VSNKRKPISTKTENARKTQNINKIITERENKNYIIEKLKSTDNRILKTLHSTALRINLST